MKLVKSLLLGSAAGLVVASGAMAADLPARKAAPAEYVRVCSAYGAGFFYIPGTDTCIKIGGLVRYQYEYNQQYMRSNSATGTRAQMNLEFDVRNATAYGTLRTFARLAVARRTGTALSGTTNRGGFGIFNFGQGQYGATPDVNGASQYLQTGVFLDKAFIQFGGLTAGRAASFFDFFADAGHYTNGGIGSNVGSTNLLAYTAVFGGGFSATISIEDPLERRSGVIDLGAVAAAGGSQIRYAAPSFPDIVAALRVDQSWGSAQLSGAMHQVNTTRYGHTAATATALQGFNTYIGSGNSKWGWAVQGGLKLNLPMLAPGDQLWLQAAYAQGATSYGGMTNYIAGYSAVNAIGQLGVPLADAYVNNATGAISLAKTWSVAGSFIHYWTPSLRSGFYGSYGVYSVPGAFKLVGASTTNRVSYNGWRVGTNLTWSPVPNFDIGVDLAYSKLNLTGGNTVASGNVGTPFTKTGSAWNAIFRVQRGF